MSNSPKISSAAHETDEPTLNWEKHLRWLAPVTALILLATTGIMWSKGRESSVRVDVMRAYAQAVTAEDLQILADAFPGEPEAPLARLQAASMLYNDGEFERALADYSLFLKQHPGHPMADNAQWGYWMCQEAMGNLDEAMEGFRSVTEDQLLYPQALMGQARILEKQGQPDAALAIYEKLQENDPQSSWAEQARVFSERLKLGANLTP
ncbi:MAG: tetratricopeptide repeat protein [Kiritimatiellia bacterium]